MTVQRNVPRFCMRSICEYGNAHGHVRCDGDVASSFAASTVWIRRFGVFELGLPPCSDCVDLKVEVILSVNGNKVGTSEDVILVFFSCFFRIYVNL